MFKWIIIYKISWLIFLICRPICLKSQMWVDNCRWCISLPRMHHLYEINPSSPVLPSMKAHLYRVRYYMVPGTSTGMYQVQVWMWFCFGCCSIFICTYICLSICICIFTCTEFLKFYMHILLQKHIANICSNKKFTCNFSCRLFYITFNKLSTIKKLN
jgi:hypothetical protein